MTKSKFARSEYSAFTNEEILEKCIEIVDAFAERGFSLTLRALYYQLIGAGIINNLPDSKSYLRIKAHLTDARERGNFPLRALLDESRAIEGDSKVEDDLDVLTIHGQMVYTAKNARLALKVAKQSEQSLFCLVVVEKMAVKNYLEATCQELGLPLIPIKGYVSWGFVTEVLDLIHNALRNGIGREGVRILYLGDFDPDGVEIPNALLSTIKKQLFIEDENGLGDDEAWEALREANAYMSLEGEMYPHWYPPRFDDEPAIRLERLGLTLDQVKLLDLPPFPAKKDSARLASYVAKYGHDLAAMGDGIDGAGTLPAWELDALSPEYMIGLVRERYAELRSAKDEQRALECLASCRAEFDARYLKSLRRVCRELRQEKRAARKPNAAATMRFYRKPRMPKP